MPEKTPDIKVRAYQPADREFVIGLAPRLTIGMASWRDLEKGLKAVKGWLEESITQQGAKTAVFIATDLQGERLGFASVNLQKHFTGETQAYIGELAVSETSERLGAGKALVNAAEEWARQQGCRFVVLETGAANRNARNFYGKLDFKEEEVKLVKILEG